MVVVSVGGVWGEESSFLGMLGLEKWDTKVFTKKYADGGVQEEYQYYNNSINNKRVKHGWYNSYYSNGEYKEIGTYDEGLKDGEWSYFDKEHNKLGEETKGIWKDGQKWSGQHFINFKIKPSAWVETVSELPNDDDVFRGLFTYKLGVWDGLVIVYQTNGHKGAEGRLVRKRAGWWSYFTAMGVLESEYHYRNGRRDGKSLHYDGARNIIDEDIWRNGYCVDMCEEGD